MKFHENITRLALENKDYRRVIATTELSQIVLMNILPGSDIGEEVHKLDQILVFVDGNGEAILNGERKNISKNDLVLVAAGTKHNFKNTGNKDLKLFTIYTPPAHKHGIVRKTKEEAESLPEY